MQTPSSVELRATIDVEFLLQQTGWMQRVAQALLDDPHAAEDVVQETWLRALKNPPRGASEPRTLRKWLRIVTQRVALRRLESDARRRRREAEVAKSERALDTDVTTERLRLQRHLAGQVLELREPLRTAVLLRYQEELGFDDIASRLGISNDAARQRVSRGVSELRRRLDREHGGDHRRWNAAYAVLAVPPGFLQTASRTAGASFGIAGVGALLLAVVIWSGSFVFGDGAASPPGAPPTQPQSSRVAEGQPAAGPELVRVAAAAAAHLDLGVPDRDHDLHGRVVDANGAPVAGAKVLAVPPREQPFRLFPALASGPVQHTVTNAAGEFRLPISCPGAVDVRVEAHGFAITHLPNRSPGELLRVALARPTTVRGVVTTHAGRAVRGAYVRLDRLHGGSVFRTVATGRTSPDGRFRFPLVGRGRHVLRLLAPGGNHDQRVLEVAAAGIVRCDVQLRATRTVRGVVRGPDGAPVAGARLVVMRGYLTQREQGGTTLDPAMLGAGWWGQAAVRSDAGGRFTLDVPIGILPSVVIASADGFARAQATLGENDIKLFLCPGGTVSGRCVDADGKPLEGVEVTAVAQGHDGEVGHGDFVRTASAASGRFELAGLRTDLRHVVVLRRPGLGVVMRYVPEGGDLDAVALMPAASVHGVVSSSANEPQPGMYVVASPVLGAVAQRAGALPGLPATGLLRCRTDDLGRFHLTGLAPGEYRLRVAGEPVDGGARLDARSGQTHMLDLEISALPIAGEVVDRFGRPVLQAALVLHAPGFKRAVFTVTQGRFRFASVPLGTYGLRVAPNSIHTKHGHRMVHGLDLEGIRPGADRLRIVLPQAAVTKGVVVGANGTPQRHQLVFARTPQRRLVTYEATDDDGRFLLRLPPGAVVDLYLGPGAEQPFAKAVAAGSVGLRFETR